MRIDIEILRILSAFGIVWFHSGISAGKDFAYSGLAFFIITSVFFAIKSINKKLIKDRFYRLLIPYFIWFLIYGFLEYFFKGTLFFEDIDFLQIILAGSSIHLWYLPFIFFVLLCLDNVDSKIKLNRFFPVSVSLIFLFLVLTSSYWRGVLFSVPIPQYAQAIPIVLIGVSVSLSCGVLNQLAVFLLIISGLFFLAYHEFWSLFESYSIAFASACLLCRSFEFSGSRWIFSISNTTMGVYLVHPLFIYLVKAIGVAGYMIPIVAFLIALIFVWVGIKLSPPSISRWLFGTASNVSNNKYQKKSV
ncbi:acyltransferase family protein [Oceanobacter antarcticus]|uniref:Acyltransferase family protein n=1 Tax=Oceanobacter antarcticus TaxID=3133425 RepID=A0ABW8NI50_9GAMM